METKVACHLSHVLASNIARRINFSSIFRDEHDGKLGEVKKCGDLTTLTINRAMNHLQADHSAAAYCELQNAFEILAELIARLDEEDTL